MSKRVKRDRENMPYLELGELLRRWREPKFSSALAMFRDSRFSFSYSTYAAFEAGYNLPSVEQILELAKAFGEAPADALLTWARVQMPTPELQALFRSRAPGARREKLEPNPPALDNVWVLNPRELQHVVKFPWLTEVFRQLCAAHPKAISLSKFDRHGKTPGQFAKECLKPLTDAGFLIVEKESARLLLPHIHIPNNELGKKIRLGTMENTFDEMLGKLKKSEKADDILFHAHLSRGFTAAQAKRWQDRLEQLQEEFFALPYANTDDEDVPHTVMVLFGKRV